MPNPSVVASATFRGNSTSASFTYTPSAAGNMLVCVLNYNLLEFSGTASVGSGWNIASGSDILYRDDTVASSTTYDVTDFSVAVAWCVVVVEIENFNGAIAFSGGGTSPFESPVQNGFGGPLTTGGVAHWSYAGSPVSPAVANALVLFIGRATVQNLSTPAPSPGSGNYYESNDSGLALVAENIDLPSSYFFDYAVVLSVSGGPGANLSPSITFNPTQFDHAPLPTLVGTALVFHPAGTSNARVSQAALEALAVGDANVRVSQVVAEALGIDNANARVSQVILEALGIDAGKARVSQVIMEVLVSSAPVPVFEVPLQRKITMVPNYGGALPNPAINGIDQLNETVRVYVTPDALTGLNPIVTVLLYRSPYSDTGFALVTSQDVDPLARINVLVDPAPPLGVTSYYQARTADSDNVLSNASNVVSYAPSQAAQNFGPPAATL